jgi:hypothetical protein
MMSETFDFPNRRLFLSDGNKFYKVLSLTQNKSDASIYVFFPDYQDINWLTVVNENGIPKIEKIESPGEGKLSVHGSGMSKISPNVHDLVIHGSHLADMENKVAGVRHLFTMRLAKPFYEPPSPAFNRKSDYVINSKNWTPINLIFFAIPRIKPIKIQFTMSFHIDELETVPPEGGGGIIELVLHNVFWYAYRTKFMDDWVPKPHVCYLDGYIVPVLMGAEGKKAIAQFRFPQYRLTNDELIITL